jgi:hypothetical protein
LTKGGGVLKRIVLLVAHRCRDRTVDASLRSLHGSDRVVEADVDSAGATRAPR